MSESLDTGANLIGYVVWFFAGGLVELVFEDGFRWQWIVIALARADDPANRSWPLSV